MSQAQPTDNRPVADEAQHTADAALLARIAAGEQAALGELYDRFSRPLYSVALRVLNDAAEAEDIIHDVFITLWAKARDFQSSRGHAFSWALTLTRNRAIDRVRSRKRRGELLSQAALSDLGYDETDAADHDSATTLWFKEKASAVRRALATLPADQRKALELAYFSGLTQIEIAAQLAEPLGTIKARIRRGLLKLRDVIAPQL
jgi:RNA polymerase sigma-70 factor, ECF subfamily